MLLAGLLCKQDGRDEARASPGAHTSSPRPSAPPQSGAFCLCAEHERQLGGGSPLSSLIAAMTAAQKQRATEGLNDGSGQQSGDPARAMRQKNQVELNLGTGMKGEAPNPSFG